jgi:hypothetical protein
MGNAAGSGRGVRHAALAGGVLATRLAGVGVQTSAEHRLGEP